MTQEKIITLPLGVALDGLIHFHGAWRVLAAYLAGVIRVAAMKKQLEHMPEHLRRDIGLPPRAEPLPGRERIL